MEAYAAGNVTLANAPGNGVADNKAMYPFVPEMIRFYLDEEPVLGQVETFVCARPNELSHVVENIQHMVVKAVDGSGGYGMLFGPRSTRAQADEFVSKIRATPEGYIAQPVVELSTCPTWIDGEAARRRRTLSAFPWRRRERGAHAGVPHLGQAQPNRDRRVGPLGSGKRPDGT